MQFLSIFRKTWWLRMSKTLNKEKIRCPGGFLEEIKSMCVETRRERPKSAPYLRLKNIQGTTIGKIWKKIFSKKKFLIFFSKKSIF